MASEKIKRNSKPSMEKTVDSVIVHDMKNLAFRLSTLLHNMEENYENPLFKKSMLDVLGDTIRKMNDIVTRFREQQQHVMIKVKVDVNHVLCQILRNLPPNSAKQIEVNTQLDDLPPIWGDPFYLHNAFQSIIENATEAMPHGGRLAVKSRLSRRGKSLKAIIEISDTGIGMSQTFMENKLFRPFLSTKDQGLGLGLYTSQQIFALHHGKIEVKSAPGKGSTFRIVLPVEVNASA